MIGAPRPDREALGGPWPGILAALALGLLLALRSATPADAAPTVEAGRDAYLRQVARQAEATFGDLGAQLDAARDAARSGAALIVAGDAPPRDPLELAADRLDGAGPAATAARNAAGRLRGTLAAVRPGQQGSVPDLPPAAVLASIGGQLRSAADAADPFLERRHAAQATLTELAAALAALEDDDLEAALRALDRAAQARSVLATWEQPPNTLGLWLETTAAMLDAARQVAEAAQSGDAAAARRAADAYAAAAADARRADVSLGLSLSETGGGLTSTPLRRLADALGALQEARAVADALGG